MKKIYINFILIFILSFILHGEDTDFYREGVKAFEKKDYIKAIEKFLQVIKKEPQDLLTNYYLGISYYYNKNYEDALNHLKFFFFNNNFENIQMVNNVFSIMSNIYREKKEWKGMINLGNLYLKKIENIKDTKNYKVFINRIISEGYSGVGNEFFQVKNYSDALSIFLQSYLYNSENIEILEKIGICNYNLENNNEAKKYFLEILKKDKINWRTKLSSIYYLSEIIEGPIEWAEIKRSFEKDEITGFLLSIYDCMINENYEEGFLLIKDVEKKLKTDGEFGFFLGRDILGRKGNIPIKFLMNYIKEYPSSKWIDWAIKTLFQYCQSLKVEEQKLIKKDVEKLVNEILLNNPDIPQFYQFFILSTDLKFIDTPETEELYEEKIKIYDEFIEKNPESKFKREIMKKKAEIYAEKLFNYEKAIEIYEKIIEEDNKQIYLFPTIAKWYENIKNYEKAINILQSYLSERKDDEYVKLQLAKLYLLGGKDRDGIEILKLLNEKAKNPSIKEQTYEVLKNYREIKIENENKEFTLIPIISNKKLFSTNAFSLKKDTICLFQESKELFLFPFSSEKKKYPVKIDIVSEREPSSIEPFNIVMKNNNKFVIHYEMELNSSNEIWKKKEPIRIIFPYKESIAENIEIKRDFLTESASSKITVQVFLPSSGWKMEIFFSRIVGKIEKVLPQQDYSEIPGNFVYNNLKEGLWKFEIEAVVPPNLSFYYPKIRITQKNIKEVEEKKIIDKINFQDASDITYQIYSIPKSYIEKIVFEEETIYELEEKFESR